MLTCLLYYVVWLACTVLGGDSHGCVQRVICGTCGARVEANSRLCAIPMGQDEPNLSVPCVVD